MLVLRHVAKSFPGPRPRVVLQDVSLALEAGEFVALMGESGAGKSTLLNLIAGLDRPDAGEIVFEGAALAQLDDDARTRLRRRAMGFVFQAFHVLPYLDVADNVGLPLELLGTPPAEIRARVEAMLGAVGLAARAEAWPRELSGGELQRVAIARALVHRPRLVLADEPTGNLDAGNAGEILALIREQVRANGAGCILVTHSLAAARVADRILVLGADGIRERGIE